MNFILQLLLLSIVQQVHTKVSSAQRRLVNLLGKGR